jgi:hypothetical protein
MPCQVLASRWGQAFGLVNAATKEHFRFWRRGTHLLRIDGSTAGRQDLINQFNSSANVRLFLISTRAGNMGINLQAASRVVLFDCSWNPAHDLQATHRSYRYGQDRSVFIYRLIAAGAMEEKIYKMQVAKQALAARVVDAQMPENQFTLAERSELMTFTDANISDDDEESARAAAMGILQRGLVDHVLSGFLTRHIRLFAAIEDHQRLLEDREEEHLNAREQAEAEEEFRRETTSTFLMQGAPTTAPTGPMLFTNQLAARPATEGRFNAPPSILMLSEGVSAQTHSVQPSVARSAQDRSHAGTQSTQPRLRGLRYNVVYRDSTGQLFCFKAGPSSDPAGEPLASELVRLGIPPPAPMYVPAPYAQSELGPAQYAMYAPPAVMPWQPAPPAVMPRQPAPPTVMPRQPAPHHAWHAQHGAMLLDEPAPAAADTDAMSEPASVLKPAQGSTAFATRSLYFGGASA